MAMSNQFVDTAYLILSVLGIGIMAFIGGTILGEQYTTKAYARAYLSGRCVCTCPEDLRPPPGLREGPERPQ